jgi:hypothetical protein
MQSLAVYCAGTLVAKDFHELAALGLDQPPWTDRRLTGFVDFPGFHVAPGSRRGVVPDEAAEAFVRALARARSVLERVLEGYERRRAEELDRTLVRDLQRAFRDFYKQRPSYALLPVGVEGDRAAASAAASRASGSTGSTGSSAPAGSTPDGSEAGDVAAAFDEQAHVDGPPPLYRVSARAEKRSRTYHPRTSSGNSLSGTASTFSCIRYRSLPG